VFWTGATSQGQRVAGRTTHDGVLTSLDTHIIETCSDGSTFTEHWFPAQHRFVQDGIAIRGHQGGRGQTYDGRPVVVDMALEGFIGAHPRGTLSARAAMTAVSCESGPVTFTLKRSG
jgi:hypothetical protein